MIPGCKVFFQGALWGFTTLVMLIYVVREEWLGAIIAAVIWFAAMWFGLSNAFRLFRMEPRS